MAGSAAFCSFILVLSCWVVQLCVCLLAVCCRSWCNYRVCTECVHTLCRQIMLCFAACTVVDAQPGAVLALVYDSSCVESCRWECSLSQHTW